MFGRLHAAAALLTLIALPLSQTAIAADDEFKVVIQDHRFTPTEVMVPANKKFRLVVENRDATPEEFKDFVANPANGSRHNRGCAVDLTLYDLATGTPIQMVAGYDEFSPRSFPGYPGGTSRQRWHRDLLRTTMEAEGFTVYEFEWWHFDFQDWRRYPIGLRTFQELEGGPGQSVRTPST